MYHKLHQQPARPAASRAAVAARMAVTILLLGATVFAGAGRLDLPFVWGLLGLMAAAGIGLLLSVDRALLTERVRPAPGGLDRNIRGHVMPFFLAHLLVAGLDVRFGWSRMSPWVQGLGLVGMAAAFALSAWAMRVNPFFSPVVRIQHERGHRVVTGGPYRLVRHPGYAASLCMIGLSGLALGSWWSLLPNLGAAAFIVRRLLIEDRYLRANLEGYAEYARRVRSRLVPGLW